MPDRPASAIVFEVRFSDISHLVRAIDQHVVPRLDTDRLGLVCLIPGFVRLAGLIEIDNNPPVTIPLMVHQLSWRELRLGSPRSKRLPNTDHNLRKDPN